MTSLEVTASAEAIIIDCQCAHAHHGQRGCPVQAVFLRGAGAHVAVEAARWFAECEAGWVRDDATDQLVCAACFDHCSPEASHPREDPVTAALLRTAASARWADGSRVVDVADEVLVDVVAPVLRQWLTQLKSGETR